MSLKTNIKDEQVVSIQPVSSSSDGQSTTSRRSAFMPHKMFSAGSMETLELNALPDPKHNVSKHTSSFLDPKDPRNLSRTRKIVACFFLCFFGAMAAAAELILGAMLPIFVLQYAGIDPKTILQFLNIELAPGTDPLALIALLPNAPPIWKVYLLGALPVLVIGISNLINVPLATAIGRRPVILGCGLIAISGATWAGNSQSLDSHLGARCLQAIGAGTVESLIPFVIADITFEHQRNTWMSFVFATQGLIIVGLGFAAPNIIIYMSWRWIYFITAICAAGFLVGVFIFLPETRFDRDDITQHNNLYAPRTWKQDWRIFSGPARWRHGFTVFTDAMSTLFYPQILFITILSSTMIGATFAAGYTAAPPLIVKPWGWPFFHLTLCLIPILIASFGVVLVTGRIADAVSNWGARRRHDGRRAPEDQLLNLILPTLCGLIGTILYGVAGGNPTKYPWPMFLIGLGFMAFGFLGANTVSTVYVLECYPEMAGSALLNIASVRYIIAFFLSFRIAEWVIDLGYAKSFMIYTIILAVCTALLPLVWYFGPRWKERFPGRKTAL